MGTPDRGTTSYRRSTSLFRAPRSLSAKSALLLGATILVHSVAARAADEPAPGPDASTPNSLRAAVAQLGQAYDFPIVGLSRLGLEPAASPEEDQMPAARLRSLLGNYSYIVDLREGANNPDDAPARLLIIGTAHDGTAGSAGAAQPGTQVATGAANPSGTSKQSAQSGMTRTLNQLAAASMRIPSTEPKQAADQIAGAGRAAPPTPPRPAAWQDPRQYDMAALTARARANVIDLANSLRSVCIKGAGC
jgi:hypothetical protein